MEKAKVTLAMAFMLVGLWSCQNIGGSSIEPEIGETTSALRTASMVDEHSDVTGIKYIVSPCDDPTDETEVQRPLEDQILPGNIPELKNKPLDEDSEHLFADMFLVLEPGCYDVFAQPITETGEDSAICSAAWKEDVEVYEAQVTEFLLLIQCAGEDLGGIDIIAALNHEPSLDNVVFDDSKFVCGSKETICMEGSDVDEDPIEFELTAEDRCEVAKLDDKCFEVTCPEWGRADLIGRVYDLAWQGDSLIRIEDWLAAEGYPNESHGELNFWAYFDGFKYYPDADGDGYGDAGAEATLACNGEDPPAGHVADNTDCDDGNPEVRPGAAEVCDGMDNDCDGETDEGLTFDGDGDGHTTPESCEGTKDDCVDDDPEVWGCCFLTADVVMFHDLSGSFVDDLPNVKAMAPTIFDRLTDEGVDVQLGVASFIDKPYFPFGGAGDYVFQIDQPLTADKTTFVNAVDALTLGSGADAPESQIEGLMHIGTHADIAGGMGYRPADDTERYVIMMTDATYHADGDCYKGGAGPCTSVNNGDATIDLYEDYPTIAQVAGALAAEEITPIFAVTNCQIPSFQRLVADLTAAGAPEGTVVELAADSSNIVEAVMAGLSCD